LVRPTQPTALAKAGKMTPKDITRALKQYEIDVEKMNPALA
jgi:pyruvate dehydrogenase complex dehydrogenase (E1) component